MLQPKLKDWTFINLTKRTFTFALELCREREKLENLISQPSTRKIQHWLHNHWHPIRLYSFVIMQQFWINPYVPLPLPLHALMLKPTK
jgi:hypothetical protein